MLCTNLNIFLPHLSTFDTFVLYLSILCPAILINTRYILSLIFITETHSFGSCKLLNINNLNHIINSSFIHLFDYERSFKSLFFSSRRSLYVEIDLSPLYLMLKQEGKPGTWNIYLNLSSSNCRRYICSKRHCVLLIM